MIEWKWVPLDLTLAVHDRLIAEFGGLAGVKNLGSIESALAAPRWIDNFADPESPPDAAALAACYLESLARAHGFHDGNKRIAWAAAALFLDVNGFDVTVSQADIIETVQNIADATHPMGEDDLVSWFRERVSKTV